MVPRNVVAPTSSSTGTAQPLGSDADMTDAQSLAEAGTQTGKLLAAAKFAPHGDYPPDKVPLLRVMGARLASARCSAHCDCLIVTVYGIEFAHSLWVIGAWLAAAKCAAHL